LIGFVPRATAADENPSLAGFPANFLYAGKRDESGLTYAIYLPDPTTFAQDELRRQMIYRPEVKNDYWLRVVLYRSSKVETFKYRGETSIRGATGSDFNSAMIHTTILGLALTNRQPPNFWVTEIPEMRFLAIFRCQAF
jgi:hypothetical protein